MVCMWQHLAQCLEHDYRYYYVIPKGSLSKGEEGGYSRLGQVEKTTCSSCPQKQDLVALFILAAAWSIYEDKVPNATYLRPRAQELTPLCVCLSVTDKWIDCFVNAACSLTPPLQPY